MLSPQQPLLDNVDFDKVLSQTYFRVAKAISEWLQGRILEEHQIVANLIRNLTAREGSCDVGAHQRLVMRSQVASLHRQGPGASDAYGSDLAVTIIAPELLFRKTAFFQMKMADAYEIRLDKAKVART